MLFITCVRVNPGMVEDARKFGDEILKNPPKGVKFMQVYHTLGRYDAIWIYEAEDPKNNSRFPPPEQGCLINGNLGCLCTGDVKDFWRVYERKG